MGRIEFRRRAGPVPTLALGAALLAAAAPAVASAAPPTAASRTAAQGAVPEILIDFYRAWFAAVEAGEPAGILALVDTDFLVKWPGGAPITDRERLRTALAALQGSFRQRVRWAVVEGRVDGDWAWARVNETATHVSIAGGRSRVLDGSHLVILRRTGGRWLLHRDYASLNGPPSER